MADAREFWRAKPLGWRSRERVVALGEEFGAAGPLVLDLLEELAKEGRQGDEVRTGLRAIARHAFLPRGEEGRELARRILEFAAEVNAVDDLTISDDLEQRVTCRVSGFARDQGKGTAALTRAARRARTVAPEPGHCPPTADKEVACPPTADKEVACPPTADKEVACPPTADSVRKEKRREEKNTPPYPPKGETQVPFDLVGSELPRRPPTGRHRDIQAYEQQAAAWLAAHADILVDADGVPLDRTELDAAQRHLPPDTALTAENLVAGWRRFEARLGTVAA